MKSEWSSNAVAPQGSIVVDTRMRAACLERLATALAGYRDLAVTVRADGPAPCLAARNMTTPQLAETVTVTRSGDDVIERSCRLLAQRLGHPPETVDQCITLERKFPGWGVWYAPVPIMRNKFGQIPASGDARSSTGATDRRIVSGAARGRCSSRAGSVRAGSPRG